MFLVMFVVLRSSQNNALCVKRSKVAKMDRRITEHLAFGMLSATG